MRHCDEQQIVTHFQGRVLDEEAREYLRFHCRRYAALLAVIDYCSSLLADRGGSPCRRLLDIGPSFLTQYLRDTAPALRVDSLGFDDPRITRRAGDTHIEYDLTLSDNAASWPRAEPYDIIVMAEVIEHLPIAPSQVLDFLSSLLRPGGFLVIQTPNACSLPKRLRVMAGKNPYELIRESKQNPGHFREYTRQELQSFAEAANFSIQSSFTANYFRRETLGSALFRKLERLVPGNWRDGITMCLRKQGEETPA